MSFFEQSARFYVPTPQGIVPFSEVPRAKGGGMRRATIADAKAMNPRPFPSVTTVLKSISRPALESWKMRKVAEAARTLPQLADKTDEEFYARVAEDAFEERDDAADLGTRIHDDLSGWIESKWLGGKGSGCIVQYTEDCKRWLSENVTKVYSSEKVVANSFIGYAGRMDLSCHVKGVPAIVDFKSQRVKRNSKGEPKPGFYLEYPLQLASYAHASGYSNAKLISIIIDTMEPGPSFVKDWTDEHTCSYYFDIFCKVLDLWKYNNEW